MWEKDDLHAMYIRNSVLKLFRFVKSSESGILFKASWVNSGLIKRLPFSSLIVFF